MKSHPDIGDLPQCAHCTVRDWHECDVLRDDRRTVAVFNCYCCGDLGVALDVDDSAHVDFTGAFDV